jgi:predicted Fe-Mo cluster-binding NifX family protein
VQESLYESSENKLANISAAQEVIANPHRDVETAKGIRVAEWLVQQKVDQVFMKEDLSHKGPAYVFGQAGVITEKTAASQLVEILPDFMSDKPGDSVLKQREMPWR